VEEERVRHRRGLFLAGRIAVSAAVLAVLIPRVDFGSILPHDGTGSVAWLVAGLGVMLAGVMLATLRWQRVLGGLDHPTALPPLLSYGLAGMFVSSFLPSTVGGDVVRVVRLSAANGDAPESFASVVLDRLTGFVVLPFITLIALVTHPELLHLGTASRLALVMSGGTLLALVGLLALALSPRLGGRLAGKPSWLRFVGAVHVGLDRLRHRPGAISSVLGVALAYQLAMVLAAWVAARALGIELGWAPAMAFIPVVAAAQVLPLSVGGLGLREGALVLVLAPLGVETTQAVALGLLLYGMNMAVSLLGAPAFALGPERSTRAGDAGPRSTKAVA
jgi:uncharacterized membrane protein YbhN (UPF0104 family)